MTTELYTLQSVPAFNARKGLKRWGLSGADACIPEHAKASADLWTDREGRLLVRFSCLEYVYHYQMVSAKGHPIGDDEQDAVAEFLLEKLHLWVEEGIDDDVLNM